MTATGSELGSVLITLNDDKPGERVFVVHGKRGNDEVVSGASAALAWKSGTESSITLTLVSCFEDPIFDPDAWLSRQPARRRPARWRPAQRWRDRSAPPPPDGAGDVPADGSGDGTIDNRPGDGATRRWPD